MASSSFFFLSASFCASSRSFSAFFLALTCLSWAISTAFLALIWASSRALFGSFFDTFFFATTFLFTTTFFLNTGFFFFFLRAFFFFFFQAEWRRRRPHPALV